MRPPLPRPRGPSRDLFQRRTAAGLTLRQVAAAAGVGLNAASECERGKRPYLLALLGQALDTLAGGGRSPSPDSSRPASPAPAFQTTEA